MTDRVPATHFNDMAPRPRVDDARLTSVTEGATSIEAVRVWFDRHGRSSRLTNAALIELGTVLKDVAMMAAVNGWMEGHMEGEDECPGCTERGEEGKHPEGGREAAFLRTLPAGSAES